MNIGQQILFLVSALGAVNGFLLGLYLLLNKKRRSLPAMLLGVLLLALSIRVAKSVFLYFNPQLPWPFRQLGLATCFLIGPALYYFYRAALTKVTRVPVSWKWSWGIQVGIQVALGLFFPYAARPALWNHVIVYLIYAQWCIGLVAAGFLLKPALQAFFRRPLQLGRAEKFHLLLYAGNCIIFLTYLLALFRVVSFMYICGPVSFSFILYLTVFLGVYDGMESTTLPAKAVKKKIADNDARAWLEKLEQEILDKTLYKDPNLKLNDLAQRINISGHQLSQLLNDNLGKSFSTYINEFRINEACRLITTNDRLTLEAIGYEVGYNSKSTFYAAFRKIKDTTPALYKEGLAAERQ